MFFYALQVNTTAEHKSDNYCQTFSCKTAAGLRVHCSVIYHNTDLYSVLNASVLFKQRCYTFQRTFQSFPASLYFCVPLVK